MIGSVIMLDREGHYPGNLSLEKSRVNLIFVKMPHRPNDPSKKRWY